MKDRIDILEKYSFDELRSAAWMIQENKSNDHAEYFAGKDSYELLCDIIDYQLGQVVKEKKEESDFTIAADIYRKEFGQELSCKDYFKLLKIV